jgi:hypothetical protein
MTRLWTYGVIVTAVLGADMFRPATVRAQELLLTRHRCPSRTCGSPLLHLRGTSVAPDRTAAHGLYSHVR